MTYGTMIKGERTKKSELVIVGKWR